MNKLNTLIVAMLCSTALYAQVEEVEVVEEEVEVTEEENVIITEEKIVITESGEGEPDTTRMKIGGREIIIISNDDDVDIEYDIDFDDDDFETHKPHKTKAHWAGLELGVMMLMNHSTGYRFDDNPYWENDAAKSQVWNLNLFEHKFRLGSPNVGITTGLGFSWTATAFRDDYLLVSNADTIYAEIDTVNTYSKNKLKASYLTLPLLLEFTTAGKSDNSFYFSAGVIGGVRLGSKVKRKGEFDGKEFTQKEKGVYNLSSFKMDATARMGYGAVGVFASYSLIPMFAQDRTVDIYPLTFGLSLNF